MKLLPQFALLSLLASASVSAAASSSLRGGNVDSLDTKKQMKPIAPSELNWKDTFAQTWRKLIGGDDTEVNKMKALRTTPDKMKALRMKKEALEKKKAGEPQSGPILLTTR